MGGMVGEGHWSFVGLMWESILHRLNAKSKFKVLSRMFDAVYVLHAESVVSASDAGIDMHDTTLNFVGT